MPVDKIASPKCVDVMNKTFIIKTYWRDLFLLSTWFHLKHRGVLRLEGPDSVKFLQGLVTNDVNLLSETQALYSLLLSPQGRFQHDFFMIQNRAGQIFLTPELERLDDLKKKLSLYKLKSDVQIEDVSKDIFLLWQPHESMNEPGTVLETEAPLIFIDPRRAAMGLYSLSPAAQSLSEDLSLYQETRIKLGIPDGSLDMGVDQAIPLENNMDELHAISWTKGCYLGQELTSRTKHVGEVRKKLFPVSVQKGPLPTFGESVFFNDEVMGSFKSSVRNLGLALLRSENIETLKEGPLSPMWW